MKKDLISIKDITKDEIIDILKLAEKLEKNRPKDILKGKVMASLFFEPSTRTRLSFESAMSKLGGKIIGFQDKDSTSVKKGETLHDTIKMVENYADIIVMRHPQEGSARLAADTSKVPVINAGDGANQHPTQTLLDLYTIKKTQKKLTNIKVAMIGDLRYGRTVHSLTYALTHFNAELFFVSPKTLEMPKYILEHLEKNNIKYTIASTIEEIIPHIDILYMTRIQKERFPDEKDYEKVKNEFILKRSMLNGAKYNMKILHPLPRVNEIEKSIDDTEFAYYFQQSENGIYTRQALLVKLTK